MTGSSPLYLSSGDVLTIAEYACDDMQVVVRDVGLLESAVCRPSASMFGEEAYRDLMEKAASLLQSLAVNHPLIDGNRRTAWLSCVTFLSINGVSLRPDIDDAEDLVIAVATGQLDEVKLIAERLRLLREQPDVS
ncbi:type II toxin-antitoxin system death-on-curing family toxin [Streptomyces sp. PT12]|uniref:type II toxin-antitoxin system death-on-curing family toxin n=1 Tax=Streptomyces sp. PT12 TaxID=1510197 RepID=UPI00215C3039|nr:type II toxin-antitoxin system death-on-curing family toxin [Streptomyces sp. PT12]